MLPLFAGLTDEQQDHVIDCLAAHVGSRGGVSRRARSTGSARRGGSCAPRDTRASRQRVANRVSNRIAPPGSGRLPIAAADLERAAAIAADGWKLPRAAGRRRRASR